MKKDKFKVDLTKKAPNDKVTDKKTTHQPGEVRVGFRGVPTANGHSDGVAGRAAGILCRRHEITSLLMMIIKYSGNFGASNFSEQHSDPQGEFKTARAKRSGI